MNLPRPTDAAVQQVMCETGMERLQAYRHMQQRLQLQDQQKRKPDPYPLGKSAYDA